jgi:hypothetical protein
LVPDISNKQNTFIFKGPEFFLENYRLLKIKIHSIVSQENRILTHAAVNMSKPAKSLYVS